MTVSTNARLKLTALAVALTGSFCGAAQAQISDGVVRVGVLTDMSGFLSQFSGMGSVVAAQMAIDDCLAKECKGLKIELLSADHQSKTDLALAKAREWADVNKVDAYADMVNSAVALAMNTLATQKDKVALFTGGPVKITNEDCQPERSVQWMWDTYGQTVASINGAAKPGQSWYFVTVDYVYGNTASAEARKQLEAMGAKVIGESKHPLNSNDMSSQIIAAQQSKAQVVAFLNSGGDTVNALKSANDFRMGNSQVMTAFFPTVYDIKAKGLRFPEPFYWDLDAGTRRFSKRFMDIYKKGPPSLTHAGVYSSVYHYLKAVAASRSDDARTVVKKMHEIPIQDDVVRNAKLRADGRMLHDYYYFKVKTPQESKGPWDLYTLEKTLSGEEVFLPQSESQCRVFKPAAR